MISICPPCSTTNRRPVPSRGCSTSSGLEKPLATGIKSKVAGAGMGVGSEEELPPQPQTRRVAEAIHSGPAFRRRECLPDFTWRSDRLILTAQIAEVQCHRVSARAEELAHEYGGLRIPVVPLAAFISVALIEPPRGPHFIGAVENHAPVARIFGKALGLRQKPLGDAQAAIGLAHIHSFDFGGVARD